MSDFLKMILFKDLDHGGIFKRSRFTVSWSRYSFLKFKVTLFKYQTKLFYHDFNFFGCTFCINLADLDRVFNFCRGTFYYFRHQLLLLHQDKPQPHFQKITPLTKTQETLFYQSKNLKAVNTQQLPLFTLQPSITN